MHSTSGLDSPRYRALLQLLRTADVIVDASRSFFERWDLSPSQFNVLNLLHLNPEGLSQTDLSRLLIVHRSNITGLVDRLEKRDLLRREEVAADRRAYRVVLTAPGRKLVSQILPGYYAGAEKVWADIPTQRIGDLIVDLEQIATAARNLAEELHQNHKKS